jgi:hypothetical protein
MFESKSISNDLVLAADSWLIHYVDWQHGNYIDIFKTLR